MSREAEIVSKFAAENRRDVPITAPQKPVPPRPATAASRRAFAEAYAQYPHELQAYYSSVIASLDRKSRALGQLQNQMGEVSAAGVEPEAAHFIGTQINLLGDGRSMLLEAAHIFESRRAALMRGEQASFLDDVCVPLVSSFPSNGLSVTGALLGAAKVFSNVADRNAQEKKEIEDLTSLYRGRQMAVQRDEVEGQTARNRMLSSLSSKYPDLDWSFLTPHPSTH